MKGEITKTLLTADNLSAGYGGKIVLSGVNLSLESGDFLGILGPNGSGKTTLLRALTGILSPRSGEVRWEGILLSRIPARSLARDLAVISQTAPSALDLPVEQIVMLGRIPHFTRWQWFPGAEDRECVEWSLRVTETESLRQANFLNLSGGEQQRVLIALALAQKPRALLMDEPTVHLDINYQIELFELLRKLNRELGLTILTILHDLNLAGAYCRRLAFLKEGRIWGSGTARDLFTVEALQQLFNVKMGIVTDPRSGTPLIFPPPSQQGD